MKKTIRLRTPFDVSEIPLSEYPRPQFARESYVCLNGKWQYAIYRKSQPFGGWQGDIVVPFSPESLLSGLPEGTWVSPEDVLYYRREFTLNKKFIKAKVFLNFDAVDFECRVRLNGTDVGGHKGGYVPFSIDVTGIIAEGNNVIEVEVTDPSDTSFHARAKQSTKPGGIWYTPQSGIWQSVWLESVPESYIKDFTLIPDIDYDTITVKLQLSDKSAPAKIEIYDGDKPMLTFDGKHGDNVIRIDGYELWSPENPKLYDIKLTVGKDVVKSYFGMRKFSVVTDSKGIRRLGLNNKPYFHSGVLDQGYWSDGMLTPPSDAALEYDVKLVKSMGFNMIRKHIKIEPMRWYYYCDREGLLVWQDMVSGGGKYNFLTIGALPFIGIHLKDDRYGMFARNDEEGRKEFVSEMRDTVKRLKNCVSLAVWVPFNEGWGQFDSVKITEKLRDMDGTRIIDSVSGWHDQGRGSSELKSLHVYFKPVRLPEDERCIVLSEFGGYSLPSSGHMFSPDKLFGYKMYDNEKDFAEAFEKLYDKQIVPLIEKGLSATVYTQVSDVEEEINGLVTYDRKKIKLPVETARRVNAKLKL